MTVNDVATAQIASIASDAAASAEDTAVSVE